MLQGMLHSVSLVPHTSSLQDVLTTWHALNALPAQVHAIKEYMSQQLMQFQTDRQLVLSAADAKADLMGCLEAVAGSEQDSQAVTNAIRNCVLAAIDELQVIPPATSMSVLGLCVVLIVWYILTLVVFVYAVGCRVVHGLVLLHIKPVTFCQREPKKQCLHCLWHQNKHSS